MRLSRRWLILTGSLALILTTACSVSALLPSPAEPARPVTQASEAACAANPAACTPTASLQGVENSQAGEPTATATVSPATDTPLPLLSDTPEALPTTESVLPTPCPPDLCTYPSPLFLRRPIDPPGNDSIDVTYRFGSTQGGMRDPHHGVEFLNGYGTPVLAAGDGVVVVAGTDLDPTSPRGAWPITFYGPYMNFYGNLVVIEHQVPEALLQARPDMPQPLYTLYGHLSEIEVQVGQQVSAGQQIGKVGQAGIATGSHLHFEVRLGENTYKASHNPELWLASHQDAGGQPRGAIAGRFLDSYQNSLEKDSIVLQHLPQGPDGPSDFEVSVMTYEEKGLVGRPPWLESFGVGDLPAGWYRISFPMGGLRQELVQVLPGQLTVVTFR
jgi:murein DD-endopeptidase MepM/ murein hydrolase activator NlpD